MIKPTIGRIVWFWPTTVDVQPQAAIVAYVFRDDLVTLTVFDHNGVSSPETHVLLYQGEGDRPTTRFCEWMPYQIGQAAKAEAAEAQLENIISGAQAAPPKTL